MALPPEVQRAFNEAQQTFRRMLREEVGDAEERTKREILEKYLPQQKHDVLQEAKRGWEDYVVGWMPDRAKRTILEGHWHNFRHIGGGADCMFEHLVSTCFADLENFVEGQEYESISGCTFRGWTTIQGPIDYEDGLAGDAVDTTIFVCDGEYGNISIPATWGTSGTLRVIGASRSTVLVGSTTSGTALTFAEGENQFNPFIFENIRFQGADDAASVAGTHINIYAHFIQCHFNRKVGADFGTDVSLFQDCRFDGELSGTYDTTGYTPNDVVFLRCNFGNNLTIAGNTSDHWFIGCDLLDVAINVTANIATFVLSECNFYGSSTAAQSLHFNGGSIDGLKVIGCQFPSPGSANGVIYFQTVTGMRSGAIVGNHFHHEANTRPFITSASANVEGLLVAGNNFLRRGSANTYIEDDGGVSIAGQFKESVFGPNTPPDFDIDITATSSNNLYIGTRATVTGSEGTTLINQASHDAVTVSDGEHSLSGQILSGVDASATQVGHVELATQAEVDAGTDTGRVVTPETLSEAVQDGQYVYAADAEASDTYVITLTPAPAAYVTGQVFHFKANTANTGAATLNVNALGATTIKKLHDQDLATGDIESGQIVTVVYDGTNFQMQSQTAAAGSGHTIQDEGSGIADRANLNFLGSMVQAIDDAVDSSDVYTGFRHYDAIVDSGSYVASISQESTGTIPIYNTLQAAIDEGPGTHTSILFRQSADGSAITLDSSSNVTYIVGDTLSGANIPQSITISKSGVLVSNVGFTNVAVTVSGIGSALQACRFTGSTTVTLSGTGTSLVACVGTGLSAATAISLQASNVRVQACSFTLNSTTTAVVGATIGASTATIIGNIFVGNAETGYFIDTSACVVSTAVSITGNIFNHIAGMTGCIKGAILHNISGNSFSSPSLTSSATTYSMISGTYRSVITGNTFSVGTVGSASVAAIYKAIAAGSGSSGGNLVANNVFLHSSTSAIGGYMAVEVEVGPAIISSNIFMMTGNGLGLAIAVHALDSEYIMSGNQFFSGGSGMSITRWTPVWKGAQGTADQVSSSTTTSITVSGTPWVANQWNGYMVKTVTNQPIHRTITSTTTNTISWADAMPSAPAATTRFAIWAQGDGLTFADIVEGNHSGFRTIRTAKYD